MNILVDKILHHLLQMLFNNCWMLGKWNKSVIKNKKKLFAFLKNILIKNRKKKFT